MAQHKATDSRVLRSALKHKKAADEWLAAISAVQAEVDGVNAKIVADAAGYTGTEWDVDYVATHGTDLFDSDGILVGQYKRTLRDVMRSSLAHKKLADALMDAMEEISVSYNAVLAQMDADAGTLSDDNTYEAYRIAAADLLSSDSREGGQHDAKSGRSLRSALSHKPLADKLIADMRALQDQVNSMIDAVQAANA